MDVFRVERRNEGLVQAGEDLVDQFVAAVFQHVDFGGDSRPAAELPARTPSSSRRAASEIISTCFRNRP